MYLGDFGTPPPDDAEPITFGWFGDQMRAHPELCEVDYIDFMNAAGGVDTTERSAAGRIKDFVRMCVHPDDFDRFWSLARTYKQQVDDLFTVCLKVVEAVGERPTGRSSDSSGGPSRTARSSGGDDFSTAMAANAGRPDRQLALVRAHEAQEAATG